MGSGELGRAFSRLIRERRFTAAIEACDKALTEQLSPADKSLILQLKAQALVAEDHRWDGPAMECLIEALKLVADNPVDLAQVYCTLTGICAKTGNVVLCRRYRNAFVEIWKTHRQQVPELDKLYAHAEYNLALAVHEMELLEEAEDAYLLALGAYQKLNDPTAEPFVVKIKHNLIDLFQEIGRHFEAKGLMDQLQEHYPDDTYGAQTRDRKAIWALHKGDLTSALLWVESGLGHPSCDLPTRAHLMLTKARIAQASGQTAMAHDLALEAFRLSALAQNARIGHRVSLFIKSLSKGD